MDPVMRTPNAGSDHTARDWGAVIVGLVFVGVGAYFLLKDTLRVNLPDIEWDTAWPLILVALGVVVLVRAATGWDDRSIRRDRRR